MIKNAKVRTRLVLLLLVTFFATLALGVVGVINAINTGQEVDKVYLSGINNTQYLSEIRNTYNNILKEVIAVIQGSSTAMEVSQAIPQEIKKIHAVWEVYLKNPSLLDAAGLSEREKLVEKIENLISRFDSVSGNLLQLLPGEKEKLINFYFSELFPIVDSLSTPIADLGILHAKNAKETYDNAAWESSFFVEVSVAVFVFAMSCSIILGIIIIRSIVKPLEYAVENVNHIAKGDVSLDIEITSGGELGDLLMALRNMVASTEKMSSLLASVSEGDLTVNVVPRSEKDLLGHTIKEMIEKKQIMIGEIQEEVNTLTISSQDTGSSLNQISASASETAAAVTETTTTIEELKQTAQLSTDKAKDVLVNTEEMMETVKSTESSISGAIEEINQIKKRMETILDCIMQLSERSLSISEIMNTVNDLAEQSNLLAVNAAIEAAKAGDQGRSFNVVAQEIRTLAEQSKAATIQGRGLLNEIQNATNAAVLATEQGSKAVAKGVEQSQHTNNAIKIVAANTARVSQSAHQIVLSSEQQHIAVEQVTVAMTNIDEAAAQHVRQLRQIEEAMEKSNKVSSNLKRLTDSYQLHPNRKVRS